MNRFTFALLTTCIAVSFTLLSGCSDQEVENKAASPETANPAHTESSVPENSKMGHEADGHDRGAAHEEQEAMAHENGEHSGMPGMQGGSHWNAPAEATALVNPIAVEANSIQRGRNLFVNNCASCHGNSGRGDGPISKALTPKPADLVVMAPTHPAGDFYWKIQTGRGAMPAWKDTLSENQIWDVVNYIKSLGKTEPSEANDVSDEHNHAH